MKIYDSQTAVNPRRVRIFLAEKGIQIPYEQVDIVTAANRTPEFRKKNPLRAASAGAGRRYVIAEAIAICRYFEALRSRSALLGHERVGNRDGGNVNRRAEFNLMEHGRPFSSISTPS